MTFQYVPLHSDSPSSQAQRRVMVRYRCPPATLGRMFIADSYQSLDAWVLDLSAAGTGLLLGRPLEPDTWVLIELDSAAKDLALELSARVVHSTPQHDGNYLIGCAFANPLSPDELDALL